MNKNYIKLGKDTYEIKSEDGKRWVLFGGTWLTHEGFVDLLAHYKMWDQLTDLARIAFVLKPDEAAKAVNAAMSAPPATSLEDRELMHARKMGALDKLAGVTIPPVEFCLGTSASKTLKQAWMDGWTLPVKPTEPPTSRQ